MRAREFTREAAPASLGSLITKQMNPAKVQGANDTGTPGADQKNVNATQKPTFAQPGQGSMPAAQASASQTPTGGTQAVKTQDIKSGPAGQMSPNPQQGKPMGANTPGQPQGQQQIGQPASLGNQTPKQLNPIEIAQQLKQQLKPGEEFDIPGTGGPIKTVGQATPQGQKFDISKSQLGKELGVPEIVIDPKTLAKAVSQQ